MDKIIIATKNRHKVGEFKAIMPDCHILSLSDIDWDEDIIEDGDTFKENALIKARAIYKKYHCTVIADDSGLCIDYLDGAPGIYSARFLGCDTSYDIKNNEIIKMLEGVSDKERSARFICALACILDNGREIVVEGVFEGSIAHEQSGKNGFGYDPIFIPKGYSCSAAMLSDEEKNSISHRARALKMLEEILDNEGINN